MTKFLLLLPLVSLTACASYFIKADCERTNWYQYGQAAAMEGHRLSGDPRVRQCSGVGAEIDEVALDRGFKEGMSNYCQPETVYQTGKRGEFFNSDMCEQSVRLGREHTAGVRAYCQKFNGFAAGATGKAYNGICPKDLEAAFRPEFNRGRKSYLDAVIASNESAISEIESNISRLESERFMYQSQLMTLPADPAPMVTVVDPISGQVITQPSQPDLSVTSRRNQLAAEVSSLDSEIDQQRSQATQLRATNRDLRVEMTLL